MDVRVLYLDIDGTVRKTQWGMNRAGQVQVFPEAIRLMALWKARGGRIAGVSNQGGIALGIVSQSQVLAAMRETQERTGNLFDAIFFCVHHPRAESPDRSSCDCRKPLPGAVTKARSLLEEQFPGENYPASLSLMVGDRSEDAACAAAAGVNFMWAEDWLKSASLCDAGP